MFYVMYNIMSLSINGVAGGPFPSVPEGYAVCQADEEATTPFLTNEKRMNDYFVKVVDGVGTFKFKASEVLSRRKVRAGNILRDLNYKIVFFDDFNIQCNYDGKTITLTFDIDSLEDQYQSKFLDLVTPQNAHSLVYITQYQDPLALLETTELDLYQLSINKKWTYDFVSDRQISVWAARN